MKHQRAVIVAACCTCVCIFALPSWAFVTGGFIENCGQIDQAVKYYAPGSRISVYFTQNAVVLDLIEEEPRGTGRLIGDSSGASPLLGADEFGSGAMRGCAIYVRFEGANPHPVIEARGELATKYNYFLGKDPARWRTDVPAYSEIVYHDLWPGVDLVYRRDGGNLVYELVVAPGVDRQSLRFCYEGGHRMIEGSDGSVLVETSVGSLRGADTANGGQAGAFMLAQADEGASGYTESLAPADDPSALLWSTLVGGGSYDIGTSLKLDSWGHSIVAGNTRSSDFPTTPGAYDSLHNGIYDVFVAKVSSSGGTVFWSTFIGGGSSDFAGSVALGASGDVVITGNTGSSDFPTTSGAYDTLYHDHADGYVARLSTEGILLWSTFLGGTGWDYGRSVVVDASGDAVVTGETNRPDFPVTAGAYDTSHNGYEDCFVAKLSAAGDTLLWSTFLGGGLVDYGRSVALDAGGTVVIVGCTRSSDFPTTTGAYDSLHNGNAGEEDAFVAGLSAAGDTLLWSTFLGGSSYDYGWAVALDVVGNPVVAGYTRSPDFPTSPGASDTSFNGDVDAFVAKVSSVGSDLLWSTFLGGAGEDIGYSLALDSLGNALVTGYTRSFDFPTTPGAYDASHNGEPDAFVTKLSASRSMLLWSTFLGGRNWDRGFSLVTGEAGNALITGGTYSSSDFPTTPGAYDTTHNGYEDIFVVNLDLAPLGSWASITGVVRESTTMDPLEGAVVELRQDGGIKYATTSVTGGVYAIDGVMPGDYDLVGTAFGYLESWSSRTLNPGEDVTGADIAMTPVPAIAQVLPDTLTAGDTGVDMLIKGPHLGSVDSLWFEPGILDIKDWSVWDNEHIHVNLDVASISPGVLEILLWVRDSNGYVSDYYPLQVCSRWDETIRSPKDYAPTFWFATQEKWFPTSPFFQDVDGHTEYTNAAERKFRYDALPETTKKSHVTVYYDVYGDDGNEPPVKIPGRFDSDPFCRIYEYWLYFTYDEFKQCETITWNEHYHDWEKFFVCVSVEDGTVRGMIGSAHLQGITENNVFIFEDRPAPPYHPLVLVEMGGHATCPDSNRNGAFDPKPVDVNGCLPKGAAWGIQDLQPARADTDSVAGHHLGTGYHYSLVSLSSLQQVVESECTESFDFWENSRESECSGCNRLFHVLKGLYNYYPYTFSNSAVADYDPWATWVYPFFSSCWPLCWSYVSGAKFTLAHAPTEHAWRGNQNVLRTNPWTILPDCERGMSSFNGNPVAGFLKGIFYSHVCDFAMLINNDPEGSSWLGAAEEETTVPPLIYRRVGVDGEVAFANVADGCYTFFVKPEGFAPYEQRVVISPQDTLLGVNGSIPTVPDSVYFTLKVEVNDGYGDPLPMATVDVFVEPDSLFLPTLTDSLGSIYAFLDTAATYKVGVVYGGYQDSVAGVSGSVGDTVVVTFNGEGVGVRDGNLPGKPTVTALHQNYPNPFVPSTAIEFDLAVQGHVELVVYDTLGRRVRTLVSQTLPAAYHRKTWDGLSDGGEPVPSGVYFCRLKVGGQVETKKLVLTR